MSWKTDAHFMVSSKCFVNRVLSLVVNFIDLPLQLWIPPAPFCLHLHFLKLRYFFDGHYSQRVFFFFLVSFEIIEVT